jgi:hypothetical protein
MNLVAMFVEEQVKVGYMNHYGNELLRSSTLVRLGHSLSSRTCRA